MRGEILVRGETLEGDEILDRDEMVDRGETLERDERLDERLTCGDVRTLDDDVRGALEADRLETDTGARLALRIVGAEVRPRVLRCA
ncbi:MAG TPA: hypothetical protein PKG54_02130 [Phycisphaerae bacterium]|nr:hypothetical protein [Phycisphaerae bacterium]HOB73300.1 hypothetical protein [Phycisphaerae bacterium]HOJ55718.1 hypothetical protein [Phycisphaerae bacterium]HOL26119.1 hypothetical protein [Phycisphaerae bacterium]HPP22035.1 hypothetical protein [Phycisphaerae bacterium]